MGGSAGGWRVINELKQGGINADVVFLQEAAFSDTEFRSICNVARAAGYITWYVPGYEFFGRWRDSRLKGGVMVVMRNWLRAEQVHTIREASGQALFIRIQGVIFVNADRLYLLGFKASSLSMLIWVTTRARIRWRSPSVRRFSA